LIPRQRRERPRIRPARGARRKRGATGLYFVAHRGLEHVRDIGPALSTRVGRGMSRPLPLRHRRLLAKRLNARGPLTTDAIVALATALADRCPPA
jgi:hypothetical protein